MEPFLGQIQMFGFGFPPQGWATCDGQFLPISQNSALFSLLGTRFGGDGETTFRLPDLRGRDAHHVGSGPGLPTVEWGQSGGVNKVSVTTANMPNHNHSVKLRANSEDGDGTSPSGRFLSGNSQFDLYSDEGTVDMGPLVQQNVGGNQQITVTNPFLGIFHCIATVGVYPSQSKR